MCMSDLATHTTSGVALIIFCADLTEQAVDLLRVRGIRVGLQKAGKVIDVAASEPDEWFFLWPIH